MMISGSVRKVTSSNGFVTRIVQDTIAILRWQIHEIRDRSREVLDFECIRVDCTGGPEHPHEVHLLAYHRDHELLVVSKICRAVDDRVIRIANFEL